MRENRVREKIKYKLARKKNKEGHRFWYMLFKDIFDESKIFPNNNIDNLSQKISSPLKKISLLGLTLYKKVSDDKTRTQKHYVFGGLIRYKENERQGQHVIENT